MDKKLIFPFGSDAKFTLNPIYKATGEPLTEEDMLDLTVTIENKNKGISFTPLWKWTSAGIEVEVQRESIPKPLSYAVNLDFHLSDTSYSDKKKDILHYCTVISFVLDCDVEGDESVIVEISPSYKGDDGKSAFEIAVENGFVGTEEEWLESLKGKGLPTGGDAGQVLLKLTNNDFDYTWGNAGSGTGDMQSALYDPDGIKSDVFDMDNMKEGEVNKNFTSLDRESIESRYLKPENGIPESDLSESIQESLSKADTALQSSHSTDETAHIDIRQAITDVSESLTEVETDISELRDNVSSIGQNVSVVEDNVSTLEQNVSNIGQTVSIHGEEINDIKTTLGDVSTVLDIINGEVV